MHDVLKRLTKSPEWIAARRNSIGGSDAGTIMGVDFQSIEGGYSVDSDGFQKTSTHAERLLNLWREKRGEREPEDLSDKLCVVMGSFSEPLNAAWFEKITGQHVVTNVPAHVHPDAAWRTCSLDGWLAVGPSDPIVIWEAKHCNTWRKDTEILDAYQPQLHHNMDVTGARRAFLSVLKGNADFFYVEVEYDDAYALAVRQAEEAFWACVQSGEPPVPIEPPKPPRPPGWRDIDMSTSNSWMMNAPLWLTLKPQADQFKTVVEDLKAAIPDDAKTAIGHGLKASIDKRGAVRFSAVEQPE